MKRGLVLCSLLTLALGACARGERRFDAARAFGHLEAQVALGPRVPGTPAHAAARDLFVEHFRARADTVWLHSFEQTIPLDSSRVRADNVVAVFNPEAPYRICLGAHWDSRARADEEEDPALAALPVPGANDGASGVAVLLEVATALAAHPPAVGVDLVLFDVEDGGVHEQPETWALGSARFVADHPSYRPAFAIVVDMVGRRGLRIPREGNSMAAAGGLVNVVWEIGRELELGCLVDSTSAPVFDDHVPFLRARIPAVDLIDLADPNWHTTRDLPEACAPESLDEVGRLLLGVIARAEASRRR
ncbi:MAG: M28 family peptidase [bacterium]